MTAALPDCSLDEDFGASYVGVGARNNTADENGAKPPISAHHIPTVCCGAPIGRSSAWTAVLTAKAFRCDLDADDAATSYGIAQEA